MLCKLFVIKLYILLFTNSHFAVSVHVKMYDIGVMYRELQYSTALSVK